jgi:hypothetical protein
MIRPRPGETLEYVLLPSGHAVIEHGGEKYYYWGERGVAEWAANWSPSRPVVVKK